MFNILATIVMIIVSKFHHNANTINYLYGLQLIMLLFLLTSDAMLHWVLMNVLKIMPLFYIVYQLFHNPYCY